MIDINNLPPPLRKNKIEDKLAKVCEENDVVFLSIFGSFSRGEQNRQSDIDIAIEFDKKNRKSLLDLVHFEYELKKIFQRKVDVGIFSSLNTYIKKDVENEMKVIYERK